MNLDGIGPIYLGVAVLNRNLCGLALAKVALHDEKWVDQRILSQLQENAEEKVWSEAGILHKSQDVNDGET